jgi:hypothetical protein
VFEVVAKDALKALSANEALTEFCTLLTVKSNVELSAFVNVKVSSEIEPVVTNEPVSITGTFKANDAVVANEAEVEVSANEALKALSANEDETDVFEFSENEALKAELALSACEALVAKSANAAF